MNTREIEGRRQSATRLATLLLIVQVVVAIAALIALIMVATGSPGCSPLCDAARYSLAFNVYVATTLTAAILAGVGVAFAHARRKSATLLIAAPSIGIGATVTVAVIAYVLAATAYTPT